MAAIKIIFFTVRYMFPTFFDKETIIITCLFARRQHAVSNYKTT